MGRSEKIAGGNVINQIFGAQVANLRESGQTVANLRQTV